MGLQLEYLLGRRLLFLGACSCIEASLRAPSTLLCPASRLAQSDILAAKTPVLVARLQADLAALLGRLSSEPGGQRHVYAVRQVDDVVAEVGWPPSLRLLLG